MATPTLRPCPTSASAAGPSGCMFLSLEALPECAQAEAGGTRVGCSVQGPAGRRSTQALEHPQPGQWALQEAR